MKTVYFVRHAKSVKNADMPDMERPLDARGRDEAMQVALRIKEGVAPDTMVSSPAVRAMETAEIFAAELGYPIEKITRRKALFDQNANACRTVLREMMDTCERVMLIGHNPSIIDAARAFAPDFHDEIPTAGVVTIVFDAASWKEITEGKGKLAGAEYPQKVSNADSLKRLKKDLVVQLVERMGSVLAERDGVIAEEVRDTVHQAGEKIAEKFLKRLKAKEKQLKDQRPKTGTARPKRK